MKKQIITFFKSLELFFHTLRRTEKKNSNKPAKGYERIMRRF